MFLSRMPASTQKRGLSYLLIVILSIPGYCEPTKCPLWQLCKFVNNLLIFSEACHCKLLLFIIRICISSGFIFHKCVRKCLIVIGCSCKSQTFKWFLSNIRVTKAKIKLLKSPHSVMTLWIQLRIFISRLTCKLSSCSAREK